MNYFESKLKEYIPNIILDVLRPLWRLYLRFRYSLIRYIRWHLLSPKNRYLLRGKTKYFCIGRNKTGTTSIGKAFKDLDFPVGDQRRAEILYNRYYFNGKTNKIISYCHTAQVFQDVPFSVPETYKYLDKAFPNSKFILTIRYSADQWYTSFTRSDARFINKNEKIPTAEELKNFKHIGKGFMYSTIKLHGTSDEDPYNKEIMTAHYEHHNASIIEYFKGRPNDLLVINLAEEGSYQKFIDFLGIKSPYNDFPWENRA